MNQMPIRLQVTATIGAGLLSSGNHRYLTTDFLVVDAMDYADALIAACGEAPDIAAAVQTAVDAERKELHQVLRSDELLASAFIVQRRIGTPPPEVAP